MLQKKKYHSRNTVAEKTIDNKATHIPGRKRTARAAFVLRQAGTLTTTLVAGVPHDSFQSTLARYCFVKL